MTPDQATFLAQQITQLMSREVPVTVKVLRAVTDAGRDYRPDDRSRTAWDLAAHIAQADVWFLDCIHAGAFTSDPAQSKAVLDGFGSVDDIVRYYEREVPSRLDAIAALPGEALNSTLSFFGMFEMPRVSFLGMANNHGIHHRGQLAAYLRALGSKVPALYGESADEKLGG